MSQHTFDVSVAVKVGVPGAIILNHMLSWTEKNAADERHLHDGRFWTYSSTKALCQIFPYYSQKQIYSIIDKLVTSGYLLKGNYNEIALDRTTWYALTDAGIELLRSSRNPLISIKKCDPPSTEPESDMIDTEWRKVVACYESNIGLVPYGASGDILISFYDDLGADVVCKAIEVTNKANPNNPWKYLQAVLNRWVEQKIDTPEKADAYTKDLERRLKESKKCHSLQGQEANTPPAIQGEFY